MAALTRYSVTRFPNEDEKLRANGHARRRGGNCTNTLEVLSQLIRRDGRTNGEASAQLHLLSVLSEKQSADVQFIRQSIPGVNIDTACIFREGYGNAASSYIIQSAASKSRTIVSHNSLPEMTTQEFIDGVSAIRNESEVERHWFHFEGRIPVVTEASVRWLSDNFASAKISVECEKPERDYMEHVSREADVVFFSKIWAEVRALEGGGVCREIPVGACRMTHYFAKWRRERTADVAQAKSYNDPWTFLGAQIAHMKSSAILVCTWGSAGATCVHIKADRGEDNEWASTTAWKPTAELVEVVDTIGAGDTFIAGFLYALSCQGQWTLLRKLEFANELAGRKVLQLGFGGLADQLQLA